MQPFRVDDPFCAQLECTEAGKPGPIIPRRLAKLFMVEGYCVKCKTRKEIADGVEETMKNGRRAIKGRCSTCGTVMFKILGGKAAVTNMAPVEDPKPTESPTNETNPAPADTPPTS